MPVVLKFGVLKSHRVLEGISKNANICANLYDSFVYITNQLNIYVHDAGSSIAIKWVFPDEII